MATINNFEDLQVWQLARKLTVKIYRLSEEGPFSRDFALRNQICRAAVSIVSNISEGFERRGNRQFIQFLDIANGSAGEVRAQLYIAFDLEYINRNQFDDLMQDVVLIGKMLTALSRHIRAFRQSPPPNHPTTQPPNHLTTQPPNHSTIHG